MSLAPLSNEQLQAAREKATAARRRRAQVKQDLRDRKISLAEVLERRDDQDLAQIKVAEILRCLPRVGEKTTQQVMARLQIAANRRLRGLGHQQVARLKHGFSDA